MKTLIVYYSRSNTTKQLAEHLAERLNADIEEIIDKKNRQGPLNWLKAARDGLRGRLTEIEEPKYDPGDYELVLAGTPIWAGKTTPAIKTYLKENLDKIKKLAFFSTQGSSNEQPGLADLRKFCGREPAAELWLSTKTVRQRIPEEKVKDFIDKLF